MQDDCLKAVVFENAKLVDTSALPACKGFPRSPVSWVGRESGRPSRSCQSWCSRSLDSSPLSCMCSPPGSGWGWWKRKKRERERGTRPENDSVLFTYDVLWLQAERRATAGLCEDPQHSEEEREGNSPRVGAVPTEKSIQLAGLEVEIGWRIKKQP